MFATGVLAGNYGGDTGFLHGTYDNNEFVVAENVTDALDLAIKKSGNHKFKRN